MNKTEFLNDLKKKLTSLQAAEREKFISYYDEMIEDLIENGKTEEEAVKEIGDVDKIAKDIMEDADFGSDKNMSIGMKSVIGLLIILGFPMWGSLLLAAASLVLSAYIIIWCLPIMTGGLAIGGIGAGVGSALGSFFILSHSVGRAIFQFGVGMFLTGVGILSTLLTIYVSKNILVISKKFTLWLGHFFKNKTINL